MSSPSRPQPDLHDRIYPDLAALRAALGSPTELRVVEDTGDDALLERVLGQLVDAGGGHLLLLTHDLYDPEGIWSRVRAASDAEPETLLKLSPVLVAERLGTLVAVGPATPMRALAADRRPVPSLPLERLDRGDLDRLFRRFDPGDDRHWPPVSRARSLSWPDSNPFLLADFLPRSLA